MAHRPKDNQPFSDATEVASTSRRDDTAVDVPHGLDDPSTDVGLPPAFGTDANVSAIATQPDQAPNQPGPPPPRGQPPAGGAPEFPPELPPEFDTEVVPPSQFADATVQLPTFDRAGEPAPASQFADATVPLQVQKSARRLTPNEEQRRSRQHPPLPPPPVSAEQLDSQNIRRSPSTRPASQAPQYADLPSFENDDDIYAQPTEALTFKDDFPGHSAPTGSVPFSKADASSTSAMDAAPSGSPSERAETFDAPRALPQEPNTDGESGLGDGVPSSWIPSEIAPQPLSEEPNTDKSSEGFPSSWIPYGSAPKPERHIPSKILREAGQMVSRAERAEMDLGSPVPVPLPLADAHIDDDISNSALSNSALSNSSVSQSTGTWNPGLADSAFDPTSKLAHSEVHPTEAGVTNASSAASDVGVTPALPLAARRSNTEDQPAESPVPPKKRGGCMMVAGAGCAFVVVVGLVVGGLMLWYAAKDKSGEEAPDDTPTATTISKTDRASANGTATTTRTSEGDAGQPSAASNAAAPQNGDAPNSSEPSSSAPNGNRRDDGDAAGVPPNTDRSSGGEPESDVDPTEEDRNPPRKVGRRGKGTYLFRANGGSRSLRFALTAAVRKTIKGSGLGLARAPTRKGFDVGLKVAGSRVDVEGDALKVETDCRLTIREQPSGKLRRAMNATGTAEGPKASRSKLMTKAIGNCGTELAKAANPLLSGDK